VTSHYIQIPVVGDHMYTPSLQVGTAELASFSMNDA